MKFKNNQIENKIKRKVSTPRKILFQHKRAAGDTLMFTAGIRDFKLLFPDILINVNTPFPQIWENNPYIDRSIKKDDPGVETYKVGYPVIGSINNSYIHFTMAFLLDMVAITDLHENLPMSLGNFCLAFSNGKCGDPSLGDEGKNLDAKEPFISFRKKYKTFCENFSRQRGDLHLTQEEKDNNIIKDIYGIDKYFVVAPGGKSDCTCKIWNFSKFQKVIDYYEGKIKFVIIGRSDHIVEKLNNVVDLTDKFNKDLRGLFSLVYNAEGCVSGVSFLMHLAAAVPPRFKGERKPCVSIYGGREGPSFTAYNNHQILHTNGVFSCCLNGGCWKSRTSPLMTKADRNKNLCKQTVQDNGRTIQACMNSITADDVIRAIGKYYDGDVYTLNSSSKIEQEEEIINCSKSEQDIVFGYPVKVTADKAFSSDIQFGAQLINKKEINLLGSLSTRGGGEQSFCMIAKLLQESGWKVNVYHFGKVHENYKDIGLNIKEEMFPIAMQNNMKPGLPLLFYGNDSTTNFIENGEGVVANSSSVIIGINYINRPIPKCRWLAQSGKLKAVIFQNKEKRNEFRRDQIGFDKTRLIVLHGAIDLSKFLEVCPPAREKNNDLVVLKHCTPDYRKYVTKKPEGSEGKGERIHIWQKNIIKENDIKFYSRLLKDIKNVRFEFMQAHKELERHFKDDSRMVFHKWDSMTVTKFLSRGHVYLYRTSDQWRDQAPRVIYEAMAAGLPILGEARDGPYDRIKHGDNGFYCTDYDAYLWALKLLRRKEKYRQQMGIAAKNYAKENLNPKDWVSVIDNLV